METLKALDNTNLKDDAITGMRYSCPNEHVATHGAPLIHRFAIKSGRFYGRTRNGGRIFFKIVTLNDLTFLQRPNIATQQNPYRLKSERRRACAPCSDGRMRHVDFPALIFAGRPRIARF
jgi:hypothetical protein